MSPRTLNDIFSATCQRANAKVMLHRQPSGWMPISSADLYRNVVGLAHALKSLGIGKGDRVAIVSENRPEWTITDFAALALGAVTVPIYATQTAEHCSFVLRDSGARVVVVSTRAQLDKILAVRENTALEQVLAMDNIDHESARSLAPIMLNGPSSPDPEFEAYAAAVRPEDLATIIYTSGTTGSSKGVMLTHGNMASNISCSLEGFDFGGSVEGEVSISFLPLSHVTARHVDFALLYRGVTLAYCPDLGQLSQLLKEVRPDVFVAVPRVYEKIRHQAIVQTAAFPKNLISRWAMSVGRAHRAEVVNNQQPTSPAWKMANQIFYSKVRAGMGGKATHFLSGGAPLGRELAEWFADIGIHIYEGYGLTETSPVIAVNTPAAHKLGTVGKPLSNVEVRIADDGEVVVRGPSVFQAYWNRDEETLGAFVDGWFKTGDIGNIDADGFLSITDRKKDLIKTSGGKFIAPQPIENSLKLNPLIGTAVVIGDRRKFPAVLVAPHFPLLEEWARTNHVNYDSREQLVADLKVQALYKGIVDEANSNLARFEKLKRVVVIPEDLSAADGTLTHTFKVRRRGIEARYGKLIDDMYAKADAEGR